MNGLFVDSDIPLWLWFWADWNASINIKREGLRLFALALPKELLEQEGSLGQFPITRWDYPRIPHFKNRKVLSGG